MKHLKTIKNFTESSTFPLLSKELQRLLLEAQHDFLIQGIEDILHDSLMPYTMMIDENLSFNVCITKDREINVTYLPQDNNQDSSTEPVEESQSVIPTDKSPIQNPNMDIREEESPVCQELDSPQVTEVDKLSATLGEQTIKNGNHIGGNSPLEVKITDVMEIDRDLLTRGIIVISSQYFSDIESIMGMKVDDLDDVSIDVLFNGKIYTDASLCCVQLGSDMFGKSKKYLQLRWERQSQLGRDMKRLLSHDNQENIWGNNPSELYSYFSVRYNYIDAAFQINVFHDKYNTK